MVRTERYVKGLYLGHMREPTVDSTAPGRPAPRLSEVREVVRAEAARLQNRE
jgi:hypothetical protein